MPTNNDKQKNATTKRATVTSQPVRKAPGTRLGTLQDWRGSNNSGNVSGRHGQMIRDGR